MSSHNKMPRRDFLVGALAGAASIAGAPLTSAAPPRKLRFGVVGSGFRARGSHLRILTQHIPEVEIVALADITPENLQQGLAICGPRTAGYADHRRMLDEHPELDAVVVVVPNYKHAEVTVDSLQANKHVLTEKPIATHLADADRMIQTAGARNKILQVGLQRRYANSFRQMRDLIGQGAIGDLEFVFASLFRGDWNPRSWKYTDPVTGKKTNWRYLTLTEGSALLEDGIHELDIIHWLMDAEPTVIEAQGGNNVFRDRETIDHAGLVIQFANGAKCTFAFTIFSPRLPNAQPLRFLGSQGEMHVETEGRQESVVLHRYSGKTERVAVPEFRQEEEALKNSLRGERFDVETYREHKAFIESITTGKPPLVNGKAGRDAAHISLAAERSLRTGNPVNWSEEDL